MAVGFFSLGECYATLSGACGSLTGFAMSMAPAQSCLQPSVSAVAPYCRFLIGGIGGGCGGNRSYSIYVRPSSCDTAVAVDGVHAGFDVSHAFFTAVFAVLGLIFARNVVVRALRS